MDFHIDGAWMKCNPIRVPADFQFPVLDHRFNQWKDIVIAFDADAFTAALNDFHLGREAK